jgi:hypothetical protein
MRLAEALGFREMRRTGGVLSYTLYLEKPQLNDDRSGAATTIFSNR